MQILVVFYVMDKYNFTFSEMHLQNNFYIKDINVHGDSAQFWKYKIKDIDFYVPNYGNLLMFDSDYHDIDNKTQHKIIGTFLNNTVGEIKEQILINALECLNPNNFGQEFKNIGGIRPSDNIINLLNKICSDLSSKQFTFSDIIKRNFLKFLHNRIGTPLRDTEINYIKKSDIRPFRTGELVIWEKNYETYEIVLYINNISEYECECASKENDEFVIKQINKDLIYHYSDNEIIKQDTKNGDSYFNMDYIIESYIL
jgi:hypothetical protein